MLDISSWVLRAVTVGFAWIVIAGGCSSSSSSPPKDDRPGLYDSCDSRSCGVGTCMWLIKKYPEGPGASICTQPCGAGCPQGGICGVGTDGAQVCFPSCSGDNYVCVDGTPTACEATKDEVHCDECNCPSTLRCQPGVGCVPKAEPGAACEKDDDCKTANCSTLFKVCRTPVGGPCTTANCDRCISNTSGYSFCSRPCQGDTECGSELCLGSGLNGEFFCEPTCEGRPASSCPGICRPTADFKDQYCDCLDCHTDSPKRGVGLVCTDDSNCTSGACWGKSCGTRDCGWCVQSCSATDCPAGLECVDVPCVGPADAYCGKKCVPACPAMDVGTCAVGACRSMPSVAGAMVSVCDTRGDTLADCTSANQCLTGVCKSSKCIPPNGLANGLPCVANSDCQSMTCTASVCRGKALIGDACSTDPDCAIGQCCTSGANAGKCATSC